MRLKYRIRYRLFKGWEPQLQYNAGGAAALFWFPLNEQGYWLEPDAYNYGRVKAHNYFTRETAKRVIARAMAINHVITITNK